MKLRGGYNLKIEGRPGGFLDKASLPETLYLPLASRSFNFSQICTVHGRHVVVGDILARDPDNYDTPLLSPCSGQVDLESTTGHVVLHELSGDESGVQIKYDDAKHAHKMGSADFERHKLLNLGAWEYVKDAYTGQTPDPLSTPQAVIVSTIQLEPFLVRGDVLLEASLQQFTRGLEHLQSLLEYQPIYLVLPKIKTDISAKIKEHIRGYAWVKTIDVPLKYPYDNAAILSRHIGLKRGDGFIWSLNADGVVAVDTALTSSKPCVERVISVAGPGAKHPLHLRLTAGYPVAEIRKRYAQKHAVAVDGGILTGQLLTDDIKGIPADCKGITFVPERQSREFLAFVRPGFDRQSYAPCFMSSLRGLFAERLTNSVRGEVRPCVSCNFCEEVCPAGITPHRLHKLIYQDDIDEIERSRIDLCIECGLCSFVCPSKIELMHEFQEAKGAIAKEKAAAAKREADAAQQTDSE